MDNKLPYFVSAAESLMESVKEYLNNTKSNLVIVDNGKPLCWKDGTPVIFGSFDDVSAELSNWQMPIKNISIITEEDYIKTYLGDSWQVWYESNNSVMESHAHDEELVRQINDAWKKNHKDFREILCALYRRDIDEITNSDAFQIDMWRPDHSDGCREEIVDAFNHGMETEDWTRYNELALEDMIREWDLFATNYLEHIADDCDLECILNFLHYPYLPIYKD